MTNRRKIGSMCLYDFLMMLNGNIKKLYGAVCIKEALTGVHHECDGQNCDKCLQKYLNEEAKNERR